MKMNQDFDFTKIDPHLAHDIHKSGQEKIVGHPKVKICKTKYFDPLWSRLGVKKIFIIILEESILDNIDLNINPQEFLENTYRHFNSNNYFHLSAELNLLEAKSIDINEDTCNDLSLRKKLVLFFGEKGIDFFVVGRRLGRINTFFDEKDVQSYEKLYTINNLKDCIEEYIKYVQTPGISDGFFIDKTHFKFLVNPKKKKNILKSKPEDQLRNNLKDFLFRKTKYTWWKEPQLNSQKRLDLRTEAEGLNVFLEVKWLGKSISPDGKGIAQGHTDKTLREGVLQTLEYIKELNEDMEIKSPRNYLCAFDAREESDKKEIDWKGFNFVSEDLAIYFQQNFEVLPLIPLSYNVKIID